jgi:hypothetical protein
MINLRSPIQLAGLFVVTAGCVLTACGGKKPVGSESEPEDSTGSAASGSGSGSETRPDVTTRSLDGSGGGGTMDTDFKPTLAFRAHAASLLKVTPDEIEGGANDAATASSMPHSIAGAWAYTVWLKGNPTKDVRGWATADGTVITRDKNLGLLFAEAGVWTKSPAVTPTQLAEHLVWSYGMNNKLVIEPDDGQPAPRLQLTSDGSGTFEFFLGSRQVGPGGAGGGPLEISKIEITLLADRTAVLSAKPVKQP